MENLDEAMLQITTALANMQALMTAALEAAQGHRAQAEAMGFSPTISEQMAFLFYTTVITSMLTGGKS